MEKLNMVKDAWKYYAIKLLAALESINEKDNTL